MPDPSHRPYEPMRIIRPNPMPRLWWLNPWASSLYLHQAACAMKDYADRADRAIDLQRQIIDDQAREIICLRQLVQRLDESIISGNACTPDAHPHE